MIYGLIGEKLGHSYSKIIHEKMAEYKYDLIPLNEEEFKDFMHRRDFAAINVTIPYKQKVIAYLDDLDPLAEEIGAVNTIVNKGGYLTGYNTDFYGFIYLLKNNKIKIEGKKCLILGNGGTSQTVRVALKHLGADQIIVVSRRQSDNTITYEECYKNYSDAEIIVNTTPVGMYPNIDASPLDLTPFTRCEAVVDVIFNPLTTKLVEEARSLGIQGVTGLEMLVAQAKQAVEHFLDTQISDESIEKIHQELLRTIQ